MAEIDARAAELDAQIADPAFYSGEKAQVEETLKERSALTEEKETLEAEWLELSEELESIKPSNKAFRFRYTKWGNGS